MELRDGTVIPSYLGVSNTADFPEPSGQFDNFAARIGEVKEIIHPTDKRSRSKKFVEYRVEVQHLDERGFSVTTEYGNCSLINAFGGAADKLVYRLRERGDQVSRDGLGLGSKVVILCINGEVNNAVIVGGIRDPADSADPDAGHSLLWEFNGVRATVNKDGEFKLAFGGATKADGKLADSADQSAAGTAFTMAKNGDLIIEHGGQKVSLNHAQKSWKVEAEGKVEVAAGQDLNMSGTSGVNVDTKGATKITSVLGTKIGGDAAVDALYKGTTHRSLDAAKHATMVSGLTATITALGALASLLMASGASLQAVSVAHKVPVAGPIAGSVPLQAAATSMMACMGAVTAAITGLATVVGALSTFEAAAPTTLSLKNTTD